MSLHRFYLPPDQWAHDLWLEGQEARHLVQVLRLAPGEEVLLLDGRGRSGRFAIAETGKKKARLVLLEEQTAPAPQSRAIMALAFSKAVRRGFFMEKAVELGAHAVWLWQGDHSQGKLPADAAEACRGQLIAGAKQCGNPWLPQVETLTGGVDELVRRAAAADRRILPWEMQDTVSMLTPRLAGRPGTTVYVIGPEGGFSRRELDSLRAQVAELEDQVREGQEAAATLCLGLHWWASHLTDPAD